VNHEEGVIKCDQPLFDTITCFDADNIADLKTAIDQVSNKKIRNKLRKAFSKATKK
jgi:hypothetical protein